MTTVKHYGYGRLILGALVAIGSLTAVIAAFVIVFGRSHESLPSARLPGFRDAADESGIHFKMAFLPAEQGENFRTNLYDHGAGLAVADIDGDGDDDVLFLNQLGGNALFRNDGGGTFTDVTSDAGPLVLTDRVCVGATFADYDDDGDQDLYITSTRGGNVLLRNDGRGHFTDITEAAGVACVAHSQTPAFFDYDNDGDLDLFVTNTARWTTDEFNEETHYYKGPENLFSQIYDVSAREANRLFANRGDGSFAEVEDAAGLAGQGWSGDVALFDYDDDGLLDVFVANMLGRSQLYHNDGQGHYQDVTAETLAPTSFGAIGCAAFDFNNDARMDLFVADMHSDMWIEKGSPELVRSQRKFATRAGANASVTRIIGEEEKAFSKRIGLEDRDFLYGNTLYRNEGSGRFKEVSDAAWMETFWPWGVAVGDFDNDGYIDAFLPSGMGYPYFYWPCALMMNRGNETFIDLAAMEGIDPPPGGEFLFEMIARQPAARSSRCAAVSDFNGDGRLDLLVNNFNDRPYYFVNQFPAKHFISFRLRGVAGNHDAIGAVVKLSSEGRVMVRQVKTAGGYLSQSSKTLHFGLGNAKTVDRIEIRWPSGARQTVSAPAIDRLHEITEQVSS